MESRARSRAQTDARKVARNKMFHEGHEMPSVVVRDRERWAHFEKQAAG